jgi:putative ABC transport system permease protein
MLKNYFKTAWRNLVKNKAFSLTNLLGLTIGITCTIFILLWVQHETSWNKFHTQYDRIYQVYANRNFNGEIYTDGSIMLPLGDALEKDLPQVQQASFTSYQEGHVLSIGDKNLKKNGYRVSSHYFNIFSWKFIKGSAATALANPDAIVLTASSAKAFFGDADPIGKVLRLDNRFDVKVSGVVEDAPAASTFAFDFITPFNYDAAAMQDWQNSYTSLFILTKPNTSETSLAKSMNALIAKRSNNKNSSYFIHPMSKWRLYSDFKDGRNTGGMIEYVKLFSMVAVVILLIACINFMNLSTARSEKRAKEVGIRKTLGSGKKQLMLQFFSESMILAILAFIFSVLLIYLLLPAFNTLIDQQLTLRIQQKEFWMAGIGIILFAGLLAGCYPAIYLSSFNPVKVLKGTFVAGKKAATPRKVLVVGQFVTSILLISCTLIVYRQLQHVKNRDMGYRRENLITIIGSNDISGIYPVIKQDLLQTGLIAAVTKSSAPLTDIWNYTPAPDYEGKPAGSNMIVSAIRTSEDFIKTTGIQLLHGREFSGTPADSSSLLLNEAAVKTMGLKNPVGTIMRYRDRAYTVIGVTGNVVMTSPYNPVDPMMMLYRPTQGNFITVRLANNIQPQKALTAMEAIFKKHSPAQPFEYQFVDQEFGKKFLTEELIGKLTNLFAGLAIFICCLGLSGLAAFTIEKRVREIGIRKVLGATVQQLLFMLSGEFVYLVLIAFAIAIPLTWWSMHNWLQNYQYHTSISIWQFAVAGVGVLVLTLATVCINAMKAAVTKPVKSLRTE